jgi:hypothetical protein
MAEVVIRVRRFRVALLALCLLIGPSLAQKHLHLALAHQGTPAASNNAPAHHDDGAVCTICLGLKLAGQALSPQPPALVAPSASGSAPTAPWDARGPRRRLSPSAPAHLLRSETAVSRVFQPRGDFHVSRLRRRFGGGRARLSGRGSECRIPSSRDAGDARAIRTDDACGTPFEKTGASSTLSPYARCKKCTTAGQDLGT